MKVKILGAETIAELEKEINDFIRDQYVYDIKFQKHGRFARALIMYDDGLQDHLRNIHDYMEEN